MNCLCCNSSIESKNKRKYCSDACRKKYHTSIRSDKRKTQRESEEQFCNYCGEIIRIKIAKRRKFCNDYHADMFWSRKKCGSPLKIKLDERTHIYTKKYDRVVELILEHRRKNEDWKIKIRSS